MDSLLDSADNLTIVVFVMPYLSTIVKCNECKDYVLAEELSDIVPGDQTATKTQGEFVGKYTTPAGLTVSCIMPVLAT